MCILFIDNPYFSAYFMNTDQYIFISKTVTFAYFCNSFAIYCYFIDSILIPICRYVVTILSQ